MPIDRTAFNALLEDSGSGTDGDVIDKTMLSDTILDPVDAALAALGGAGAVNLGTASELTIATDAITVTGNHHSVDTEADAGTDNLATINGGAAILSGHLLVLKAENVARVVTVKDGTGNLLLMGGDFALDNAKHRLLLIKDGSSWYEVARNVGGAGGAPAAHATSHQNGGSDEISVAGLSGLLADAQVPMTHASSHENGGGDEISVAGLSGLLADGQTPLAHKTSHQSGGSDAIKLDDLSAPDDNTDLNVSTSTHGLFPKLPGGTTNYWREDGTWQAPAAGSGSPGGSDTQVQFNDGGAFGGDAGLVYNKTTDLLTAGALSLTLGQIAFPATQNASANANTLDDYEEGTWTPVIGGTGGESGQTYANQVGKYIKVGKLVHVQCYPTLTNKGTITTGVVIKGLPFVSENTSLQYAVAALFWQDIASAAVAMTGLVRPNTSQIELFYAGAATTNLVGGPMAAANISNGTSIGLTMTYTAGA
jgi:hypothetical protein